MIHAIIMQSTSDHHHQVGEIVFRVSQNILHDSTAFDPRNGMFNLDPNSRYFAIALFLFGRQFLVARLFFG